MVEVGKIDTMTLIERDKLDLILSEQELALSDLKARKMRSCSAGSSTWPPGRGSP